MLYGWRGGGSLGLGTFRLFLKIVLFRSRTRAFSLIVPFSFLFFNRFILVPDLERVLNNKNANLILNVLFKHFPFRSVPLQIVPIFLRTRFMRSFFFRNDWIVLDSSVYSRERTIVPQERCPALGGTIIEPLRSLHGN